MVKMGVIEKKPEPESVRPRAHVNADVDMGIAFAIKVAEPPPGSVDAKAAAADAAAKAAKSTNGTEKARSFCSRVFSRVVSIITLRWLWTRLDKYIMIVWIELMFLFYWALAFNLFHGGVYFYWRDVLVPMRHEHDPAAQREMARFVNSISVFSVFYILSTYFFVTLCIGLWKRSVHKLRSWAAFNSITIPLLVFVLIYSLCLTGITHALNISFLSVLMARALIVLLIGQIAQEIRAENEAEATARSDTNLQQIIVAHKAKKAIAAAEKVQATKSAAGAGVDDKDKGKAVLEVEKVVDGQTPALAPVIRTVTAGGQVIHNGNFMHPGCDYAETVAEFEKQGFKREEMLIVHSKGHP